MNHPLRNKIQSFWRSRVRACVIGGRRALVAAALSTLVLPVMASDDFPSQPVRLVVGWAPGGSVDVFARVLANKLTERWKKEVIVDNKPGASEILGASAVASAKPDGHTLLVVTDQALLSNQFLFSKLPYDPGKAFTPVIRIMDGPILLVVRGNSPYQNVGQVIDAAKRSPGKVTYGSNGPGGHIHQALNWLGVKQGVQLTHVPYKGGGPAIQAVLAGEVDMTAVPLSVVESFVNSKMLRVLATTSTKRLGALPDVPTFVEQGYDVDVQFLTAVVAPAGTPAPIVSKIANDIREIIADRAFSAQQIEKFGFIPLGDTPRGFAEYLTKATPVYRARISAVNVKLD